MNLAWLEVFREVARRGSLTAAGQALGYTQSAVSRQIAALEQATGVHLLDSAASRRAAHPGGPLPARPRRGDPGTDAFRPSSA